MRVRPKKFTKTLKTAKTAFLFLEAEQYFGANFERCSKLNEPFDFHPAEGILSHCHAQTLDYSTKFSFVSFNEVSGLMLCNITRCYKSAGKIESLVSEYHKKSRKDSEIFFSRMSKYFKVGEVVVMQPEVHQFLLTFLTGLQDFGAQCASIAQ